MWCWCFTLIDFWTLDINCTLQYACLNFKMFNYSGTKTNKTNIYCSIIMIMQCNSASIYISRCRMLLIEMYKSQLSNNQLKMIYSIAKKELYWCCAASFIRYVRLLFAGKLFYHFHHLSCHYLINIHQLFYAYQTKL